MATFSKINNLLNRPESSAPLGLFRILFGLLVAGELAWYSLAQPFMQVFYYDTVFHFSYPGFPRLPFFNGVAMQVYVALLGLGFLLLAAGWRYRVMKWICCLGFAYLFFLERAAFLNHWYLTLLICVLLLWIPAHRRYSMDVKLGNVDRQPHSPAWMRGLLLTLTGIVYLMSGLSKIEPDWMGGYTMDLVLQSISGPITRAPDPDAGEILAAWAIVALELLAWPLLMVRQTRKLIVFPLLAFHVGNLCMFTIGFFPLLMILLTLLFVPEWWPGARKAEQPPAVQAASRPALRSLLVLFFAVQLYLPLRHHLYPENPLWTERGMLFSWDMFLSFKGGSVDFVVEDALYETRELVDPVEEGLTWGQANKIFKSPSMILEFAHYLGEQKSATDEIISVRVFARSQCGLNGRPLQALLHPNLDLMDRHFTWTGSDLWVMPLMEREVTP